MIAMTTRSSTSVNADRIDAAVLRSKRLSLGWQTMSDFICEDGRLHANDRVTLYTKRTITATLVNVDETLVGGRKRAKWNLSRSTRLL